MTKQERKKFEREISIENSLRDYYYQKWINEDDELAYELYRVHDYVAFKLEELLK